MKKMKVYVAWLLVLALLLCACGVEMPRETTKNTTPETTDPETTGPMVNSNWTLTGEWTVSVDAAGGETLSAPGQENAAALYDAYSLGDSWDVTLEIVPNGGSARVLLCKANGDVAAAVAVNIDGRKAQLSVDEWKFGKWKILTEGTAWVNFDASVPLQLQVCRYAERGYIQISLRQDGQELIALKSSDVTVRTLSMLEKVGVGADGSAVFSNFAVGEAQRPENPMETLLKTTQPGDDGFYLAIAEQAVADMLNNFWTGDTQTGKIRPTWEGYDTKYDWRGSIWETAMLVFEIYDMWKLTGDEYYFDLLTAEAKFFRENFTEQELEAAGELFHWASDDCAWNAQMYLVYYAVTGDEWFVDRAIALLDNVNKRWYDEKLNGIYYKDGVDFMSLYEVGIAMGWLRLWEITGEQRFYDLALRSYEGMHVRLGADRGDGLYYCEANINWPVGQKDSIHEAGSSSFLTGNMGMAALSAKFYRLTGEQEYLDRVYKTNEGLLQYYDNDGVLINDRDAWTNGVYAAYYAAEVLSLPDTEKMQTLLKNTAVSIVTNARTDDGYYGGRWSGPADGAAGIWGSGSAPEQSMTTGTSVLMVVAAAILDAGLEEYAR